MKKDTFINHGIYITLGTLWGMVILLVEFFELASYAILMRPSSYSKLKTTIEILSNEEWFRELYKDPRYCRAFWYNRDIKKILLDPMNIEMLKTDVEKVKQFVELMKKNTSK